MRVDLEKIHSETAHCPLCGKDVKYRIIVGNETFEHNGTQYVYNDFRPACPECGIKLNVPWITEYNRKTREQMITDMERHGKHRKE